MKHLVGRLQASDERRVAVFAQMEHNQKLSSIGRLAAGVAHEVNNPLAVINEKAGLGLDLLHMSGNFERKDRLISLLEAIESTVERARGITHRLLGFARRMEANRQELSVPEVLTETMGFLERGAKNRGVTIGTDFAEGLPDIVSDRGQLQQVFLNIMGNALDAVPDGGKVDIACSRMASGRTLYRSGRCRRCRPQSGGILLLSRQHLRCRLPARSLHRHHRWSNQRSGHRLCPPRCTGCAQRL